LFYRSYEGVDVDDMSLMDYIAVKSAKVFLPHTAGTYVKQPFKKALCPITERLVNALQLFVLSKKLI
jgi:small subunit ribosomal protein S5e